MTRQLKARLDEMTPRSDSVRLRALINSFGGNRRNGRAVNARQCASPSRMMHRSRTSEPRAVWPAA